MTVNAPPTVSTVTIVVSLVQGTSVGCSFGMSPNGPFISLASFTPVTEIGGAHLVLAIAANPGAARTGHYEVAGHVVTVNQQSAAGIR
jgi:hypothetical protein